MNDTKYMISVMQACEEGKKIEYRTWGGSDWWIAERPLWNWNNYEYRIKPEPKYVPYDSVSEVDKDKWVVSKDTMAAYRIVAIDRCDCTVYLGGLDWVDLKELFELYHYEDGTLCGKKVEE